MIYFDSAYVAKYYLDEPESGRVRALAEAEGGVCCSMLGRVETAQVFHRKLREGAIAKAATAALFDQFEADCTFGLWTWLPLTEDFVAQAVGEFRRLSPRLVLRTADAIHLVSAKQHGVSVFTNDVRMLAAATELGVLARSV